MKGMQDCIASTLETPLRLTLEELCTWRTGTMGLQAALLTPTDIRVACMVAAIFLSVL